MANITNPEAIRFVNEVIRPTAERLRAMRAECENIQTRWFQGANGSRLADLITNSAGDPIVDGREGEGITRLTGADVTNLIGQVQTVASLNAEIVNKPCVNPLDAR